MNTEVLPDETSLRNARRARVMFTMADNGIDLLVLGRPANVRYAAGAPQLWTAGSRPFGPACVVVRTTGSVHLVSTWDEGIPDDIPHENLFGITWNPGNLLKWLAGIDGAATARIVGTDSQTPRFTKLLPKVFPEATFVDATPALDAARRVKSPEEVEAIRASTRVAEAALRAAVDALTPGVTERELTGVFMDAMASRGVTTPATQRVACVTSRPPDCVVRDGDVVAFDAAVVAGGYTGHVARSVGVGTVDEVPFTEAARRWERLLDVCRPGVACSELLAVYDEPVAGPIATGLGLGFDGPLVTHQLPATAAATVLEPGMVLAVTACAGPVIRTDPVLITSDGATVLSELR